MVYEKDNIVGLDSNIIINPQVWEASGHVSGFSRSFNRVQSCHTRFRADDLLEGKYGEVTTKDGHSQCPLAEGN